MSIRDSRAIFGAVAFLLTGAILSSMVYQYLAGEYTGAAIVRSRSWWEVVMNLQILSIAFVWFCYADRLQKREGKYKAVVMVRLFFGLLAVSVPLLIAVLSAFMGWFEVRPPAHIVDLILCVMVGFWAISTIIPRVVAVRAHDGLVNFQAYWNYFRPKSLFSISPMIMAGLVLLTDFVFGVENYYLAFPVLFYAQSAMPFFMRGFGINRGIALAR
ncbi:MAG: hypothetical protein JKY57_05860 [Kordiimonadaceae bacterium]|nr:hypothetical protein [Kordiimonadaceae bacterium]